MQSETRIHGRGMALFRTKEIRPKRHRIWNDRFPSHAYSPNNAYIIGGGDVAVARIQSEVRATTFYSRSWSGSGFDTVFRGCAALPSKNPLNKSRRWAPSGDTR